MRKRYVKNEEEKENEKLNARDNFLEAYFA